MNEKQTVAVGLSGGIDSAMTACLLLKKGYRLIGLTMSTWEGDVVSGESIRSGCFGPGEENDIESAVSICRKLDIPHYTIDLKKEYRNSVLKYFQDVYLKGKTPNPCVICNREIKFGLLPEKAKKLGLNFDYFATGHYARIVRQNNNFYVARGKDRYKDQSYFLCRLSRQQLTEVLFPLGEYLKSEIKNMAQETGFYDLLHRKESQDFIETEDYGIIFGEKGKTKGDIVTEEGKVIGGHKGIIYYTVGQRKGLELSGLPEPYYVLKIDCEKNQIVAAPKDRLYGNELRANDVVWTDEEKREKSLKLRAKIRLQHEAAECEVFPLEDNRYRVVFATPQLSITPGQIVAFYDGDLVVGGGIIDV